MCARNVAGYRQYGSQKRNSLASHLSVCRLRPAGEGLANALRRAYGGANSPAICSVGAGLPVVQPDNGRGSLIPHTTAAAGRNATQTASRGISDVRSLPDFRVTHLDSIVANDGQRFVVAEGNVAGRALAVFGYRQATHALREYSAVTSAIKGFDAVHSRAVDENHHIRVLLYRARLAQVRQQRRLVRPFLHFAG